MAPARDKWVRRFIIPETARHKKGFTIYKVTSVIFLKSSHEEVSKVSVWKRYNDFKKLHFELCILYSRSQIKESYPTFPKSKFFGRFEAEVIEERRESALKLFEFIGRHSYLYSSDTFIRFFETGHTIHSVTDCSQSDTSEEDRYVCPNSVRSQNDVRNPVEKMADTVYRSTNKVKSQRIDGTVKRIPAVNCTDKSASINCDSFEKISSYSEDDRSVNKKNNVSSKKTEGDGIVTVHDGSDLLQSWPDSSQYILIAAAHMSAAFRHEAIAEYEEAFTQYKMGISSLMFGAQSDIDKTRADLIKEKITQYLKRAEKLYNRHLNCNISSLSKSKSELQYYKVLKIMRSVMLVKDVRQNYLRIVKAVEKSSASKESISNYILRGQVPYMVHLHGCIETETTVFLILEYLSCGKLWDFVVLHYKSSDNEMYNKNAPEGGNFRETSDGIFNKIHIPCMVERVEQSERNVDIQSSSRNRRIKVENYGHLLIPKENCEYTVGSDVPTTQLVEKAQILLQSVSETLKESNTIANRLKNSSTLQSEKWNIMLTDVNSSISNEINVIEFQSGESSLSTEDASDNVINSGNSQSSDSYNSEFNSCSRYNKESTNSSIDDTSMEQEVNDDSININININIYDRNVLSNDRDLMTELNKNNNTDVEQLQELWTIPENVTRVWAAELILALEALHQQQVLVLDLNPDNVLIDDSKHVQLTYVVPHRDTDFSKHKDKEPYASPELHMFLPTVPLTPAADIWSFGVILYELIVGNKFQTRHPGIFHSHSIISIPSKVSENAKSLLFNILKYEPNERMTIPEIKQHPFFNDIDWSNLVNPI